MRTEGLRGALSPRLVAVSVAALLLAMTLAFMGSSSGTHDASVSMAPVNSKAGEEIGYTLTVTNASGDNIDNVTLEVPLDEGGNARYRVVTPVPAPENWTSELPENDDFGYARKIRWWTDNAWAYIAPGESEDFTFTATTPLYDGTYTWTSRTRDINGYVDSNSITTRVDNVPPDPPPELVWPKNDENINDNTPNLDWVAVAENSLPVTYDLLVDNDPDFLSPEVDVIGITTDDYITAELRENKWYWKVRARDNAGNIGSWSFSRSFMVDITPAEPPTRVWPADGENINDNTPNLDWDPVIDPSMPVTYDLMFKWWNENWVKRRPITIFGSHPVNYQIKVVLPFYDNTIRFLENENVGVLPYWIENYTADNMTVWVRRLENTDSTIYVYYENPSVGNVGNFDNTFAKDYGESGLVALWHMDEGGGTSTADSSGNNNTAALTTTGLWRATDGGHWDNRSDIKFSTGAHENNAGGGYVTVANSTSMDSYNNFTLETWVKITSLGWKTFFEKRSGDIYGFAVGLHAGGDDRFRFTLWTTPGSELLSLDGSAQPGEWYHVAVTYYNPTKEMKIYVDGTLQNTGTANNYFQNTGLTTYIGTNSTNSQNFGGAFDEFRLYNRVLSASEIKSHYERRKFMSPEPAVNVRGEEIAIQARISDDNYQITTELSEGIWHWKLRVVDNAGNIGVWSPLRSFRVDITSPPAPNLLAPDNGRKICDNTPTFEWTAITIENSLPATYDLQVDNDNSFLSPEVNVEGLTENTYTQPSELPNGNYSWRVRARDNAGNVGPWSSTWTLLLNSTPHDATVILAPINSKPGISVEYTLTVTDNATGDNIDNVTLEIPLDENGNALYRVATPIPAPAGWTSGVPEIDSFMYARKVRWLADNPSAHIAAGESENFTFTATTPLYDGIYTWTCLTRDIIGYVDNDSITTMVATTAWQLIETWAGTVEVPAAWQLVETWTGTIETPPWTGTAFFRLKNLYTVNVEKILDLYQGSKLVVKFYTYSNAFENENVIDNFSTPWHVEENESARHPEGIGVKKAVLVLTSDNTKNVISTIASFTVRKVDLEVRFTEIPLEWALASPAEKVALEIEFSEVPLYWALAP